MCHDGLKKLTRVVGRFAREDGGVAATEYAVMLGLIIVVSVAAIRAVGERFYNLYIEIASAVPAFS